MSEILELTTAEGMSVTCQFDSVEGISQTFTFYDMEEADNVDYWRSFFEDYAKDISEYLLEHVTTLKLSVSCNGRYEQYDTGQLSENIVMNTDHPATLTRHTIDLERKVQNQFLAVHDPGEYYMRLQEQFGSNIGHLELYNSFTLSFLFPYEFNVRALPTSFRLHRCKLSGFLDFLPYNSDDFCILHCLYPGVKPTGRKSLNGDEEYMNGFTEWFEENRLHEFYIDGYFNLDIVEKLEQRLDVNINFYTVEKKNIELYYRSGYKQDPTKVFHLVVIPMELFYDNNKQDKTQKKVTTTPIVSCNAMDDNFRAAINIKNVIRKRMAHCATLKLSVFARKRGEICQYCTGSFSKQNIAGHKAICLSSFSAKTKRDRLRVYKNPRPDQETKEFSRYVAKYRVPFAVYDFETKPVGRHVAFSYAILYLNIFDYSKSITILNSNNDPDVLLAEFLENVQEIAQHHYDLQSVDLANPEAKAKAEIPDNCPLCLKDMVDPEYNHTHFSGDNKNRRLDGYICAKCNLACTIKNKPLVFYGHNASRYDNNLFMEALLNSDQFKNFKFLAKTESRFTQVECSLAKDTRVKLLFADSRMLLAGGLASLAKSWITPQHDDNLEKLLAISYPDKDLGALVDISRKKQVFPYLALCDEDLHETKEPIPREIFHDDLYDTAISDEDYACYLDANTKLRDVIGAEEYSFIDYHDYYLTMDVILLAMVLHNFAESAYSMNRLWPLWYVSVSGYSFSALLANNKYSTKNIPEIKIPNVKVQQFMQRSIRGGFSQIFHKQIPNFNREKDLVSYVDMTSMYPSTMAIKALPYEFVRWENTNNSSNTIIINMLTNSKDDEYFFCEVDIAPLAEKFQKRVSIFPLFPENREVTPDMLSEDQRARWKISSKGKEFEGDTINCVTFYEKRNYICSWSYLKFAMEQGYEVIQFHNVARFRAHKVMSEYISSTYQQKKDLTAELNTLQKDAVAERAAISGKIAVTKVVLNGCYGSTLVNQENHSETQLFSIETDKKSMKKAISSLRFKSLLHVGGKTLVNSNKSSYTLTYPLSIGSGILWESKIMMYNFVYSLQDYLAEYGLTINSLMTDTDGYCFHIPNFHDVFKSFDQMSYHFNKDVYKVFDTRFNEPKYQMPETHEAFAMMKNETENDPIVEFNGVCSKVYSLTTASEKSMLKAKGISKILQKRYLSNELYRGVINGTNLTEDHSCEFGNFSNKQLGVTTIRVKKSYVSLTDLKSWYGENGIKPLVFGSKEHIQKTQ